VLEQIGDERFDVVTGYGVDRSRHAGLVQIGGTSPSDWCSLSWL
jgi:hypothetical protein